MSDHQYVTRQDFAQVTEVMAALQDTTLRVDERVKVLLDRQEKTDANIHEIRNSVNSLVNRVSVLESKDATEMKIQVDKNREKIFEVEKQINTLVQKESGHDSKWKIAFEYIGKLIWIIIAAWFLYKIGLQPPAIN